MGSGAFEAPAAQVRVNDESVRLISPENIVLQMVSEQGYPFGLGLLGAGAVFFIAALRRTRHDPILLGLFAGVVSLAVHELFDFSSDLPGLMLPVILASAPIIGSAEGEQRSRRRARLRLRPVVVVLIGAASCGALIACAMQQQHLTLAEDIAPIRALIDHRDAGPPWRSLAAIRRHPASAELEILAGEAAIREGEPERAAPPRPRDAACNRAPRSLIGWPGSSSRRLGRRPQAALELRLALERGRDIGDEQLIGLLGGSAVEAIPRRRDALLHMGAELVTHKRYADADRAFAAAAELDEGPCRASRASRPTLPLHPSASWPRRPSPSSTPAATRSSPRRCVPTRRSGAPIAPTR